MSSVSRYSEKTPLLIGRGIDLRPPAVEYMAREARARPLSEEEHDSQAGKCERCAAACLRNLDEFFQPNPRCGPKLPQVCYKPIKACFGFLVASAFWACPINIGVKYGCCAGCACCCAEVGGLVCGFACLGGTCVGCIQIFSDYAAHQRTFRNNSLISPKITPILNATSEIRGLVRDQHLDDCFVVVSHYVEREQEASLQFIAGSDPLPTVEEVKDRGRR